MKRTLFIIFILSIFLLFNSCDTPLNEYQAKNEDEKQIIALLNTFLEANNSGDLINLQKTFHDNGIYKSLRGGQVTKSQITETQPEWFTIAGKIELKNPEIKIAENEATVQVKSKHGAHFTSSEIFTLIKENNRWLIMKVE